MTRIVELNDTKPLAISQDDVKDGPLFVCRCGLSASWPFCDGSHKEARKEEPGKVYAYTRNVPEGTMIRRELAPAEAHDADSRPDGIEVG